MSNIIVQRILHIDLDLYGFVVFVWGLILFIKNNSIAPRKRIRLIDFRNQ